MPRHHRPFLSRSLRGLAAATLLIAGLAALLPAPAAAQPTIIASNTTDVGPLVRSEWTVQAGPSLIDTFEMVRLARDVPADQLRGSILFLPSLGTTFALYEQRDPNGAAGSSIAEFFALRGYDVYGYSPRFEGIPAGTCEAGLFDCSVMAGWDLASMLDDISFVRDHIEQLHPGTGVVAGGLSLGGILAVAVANDDPTRYDGVFPWEGMLLSNDPDVIALNTGYCAAAEAQLAAGLVFDGVGTNVFKAVAQYAASNPDGLNPIPLFPPFLTSHQVLVATLAVPTPGAVTMPVPNYILTAGSVAEDRLFFASDEKLIENVLTAFNSYTPVVLTRDIPCSLAGIDTSHTANLGAFTGSVLMIGGGQGFGAFMQDQLDAFTGASDRTLLVEPEFGHVDHFFSLRHRRYVELPILRWLRRVLD